MNTLEKLRFENASNELRNAVEEGEAIPFDGMANAKAYSDLCREWEEVRQRVETLLIAWTVSLRGGRLEKGRDRIPDTKKRQCANTKKSKLIIFCMS